MSEPIVPRVWTAEEDDELRRLWYLGKTGRQIAEQLGRTKNSVIGRVHRLNLPPPCRQVCKPTRIKRAPAPGKDRPLARVKPPAMALSSQQCRWPIGDPMKPGFAFCEAQAIVGKPYCPEHYEVAYRGAPKPNIGATSDGGIAI